MGKNSNVEMLRGRRRRAIARIQDEMDDFESLTKLSQVIFSIPVETLSGIIEAGIKRSDLGGIIQMIEAAHTCRRCDEQCAPEGVVLTNDRHDLRFALCMKCYADMRHDLHG